MRKYKKKNVMERISSTSSRNSILSDKDFPCAKATTQCSTLKKIFASKWQCLRFRSLSSYARLLCSSEEREQRTSSILNPENVKSFALVSVKLSRWSPLFSHSHRTHLLVRIFAFASHLFASLFLKMYPNMPQLYFNLQTRSK